MSTQNPTIHSSRQQARFSLKSSTTSSTTKTLDTIKSSASSSLHEAPHTKTSSKHRTSMFSGFKIPTRKWTNNWITDWWGIELISWTVSAASIVAIFALLESHRGKPLPEWPLSITVNSLVSIFATVGQMTMMAPVVECISQLKWLWFVQRPRRLSDFQEFDDASRGPTGSLFLLGKLRGQHLISLGAAITVVSIAFGPMSQQVLTYPLRLHPVGNSSAPQAYFFNGTVNPNTAESNGLALLSVGIENGLSGTTQSLSDVAASCNTGNCTWDIYSSIGVCASTTDVSSLLIHNACNEPIFNAQFDAVPGLKNPGYPCYNYSLPALAYVSVTSNVNPQSGLSAQELILENATLSVIHNTTFREYVDITILEVSNNYYGSSLLGFNILYQPGVADSINSTLPPPIALQSSLDLCIQTYNTSVIDSKTSTQLISCEILNSTVIEAAAGYSTFVVSGTSFGISPDAALGWSGFLSGSLSDSCSLLVGTLNGTNPLNNSTFCGTSSGNAFLRSMENGTDYVASTNALMENLASSLTNVIRIGAGGTVDLNQFQGVAYLPISYVETNYIWLALPAALVSLTLVFLLVTISKTRHLGAKNWKSSNFTTLQGLHPTAHSHLGGLESLSAMEEKVDEMMVRLDKNMDSRKKGMEWRLVMVN